MFTTLNIEGEVFYLVPKDEMDAIVAANTPDVPVETAEPASPKTSFLDDFLPTENYPVQEQPRQVAPTNEAVREDDGDIPEAEGRPSDYRNRFVNRSLSQHDVVTRNTANLSSLTPRRSTFDKDGKESSFEEVSV